MKKFGLILMVAAVMVACGNKAKDAEQARLDSIAKADSIAQVEAMIADSIAKAAEAQAMADSAAKAQAIADSIAAAEAKKAGKPMPKKQPVAKKATPSTSSEKITIREQDIVVKKEVKEENKATTIGDVKKKVEEDRVKEKYDKFK